MGGVIVYPFHGKRAYVSVSSADFMVLNTKS